MSKFCIDCEHYRVGICDKRGIYPYPPNKITCDNFSPVTIKKRCVAEIAKNAKQPDLCCKSGKESEVGR